MRPPTRAPGLNSADPDAPSGVEIARTVARQLGYAWEEVLLDDGVDATLGRHPWDGRPPIVLDTSAAIELGYVPVGDYAATVAAELDWLVEAARGGLALELDDAFFRPFLDYAAEDRFLAARPERRYRAFQNTVASHDRPSG